MHGAFAGFLQQHRGQYPLRAARGKQVLGENESTARFEDVVDEQHVAALDGALDVAQDRHLPRRDRGGAVARQVHELDLGREPGAMQRADQVGGEHEAALEDRDDEQISGLGGDDLGRELLAFMGDG